MQDSKIMLDQASKLLSDDTQKKALSKVLKILQNKQKDLSLYVSAY